MPSCERCGGVAVAEKHCIGHLTYPEFRSYGESVAISGVIDGRGAHVRAQDLALLLKKACDGPAGAVRVLRLEGAVIEDRLMVFPLKVSLFASFRDAVFKGAFMVDLDASCLLDFTGATFEREAAFGGFVAHDVRFFDTKFHGALAFKARIGGFALFESCEFREKVDLTRMKAGRGIKFSRTTFPREFFWPFGSAGHDPTLADRTQTAMLAADGSWWQSLPDPVRRDLVPQLVSEQRGLVEDSPESGVHFIHVTFEGHTRFDNATVQGDRCVFQHVMAHGVVDFQDAKLRSAYTLIDWSRFDQWLAIRIGGEDLDCRSSAFPDGVDIAVLCRTLAVENCWFGRSSVLRSLRGEGDIPPTRLLSLRSSDCEHLRLLSMDLAPCLFARSDKLDELTIEGELMLESPPPPRFADRRKIIAEEWEWRRTHDGWEQPARVEREADDARPHPLQVAAPMETTEIAALYRSLRKGSEDAKDEPGAADFYYGEMEMRRRTRGGGQRFILSAYWLLSGYALRPSRALASIAVTVAVFAALFQVAGFEDGSRLHAVRLDPGGVPVYEWQKPERSSAVEKGIDAVVYTAGTATTIISGPERSLNRSGRVLRVILRIVGPVLIALLVLSIRGRVKR